MRSIFALAALAALAACGSARPESSEIAQPSTAEVLAELQQRHSAVVNEISSAAADDAHNFAAPEDNATEDSVVNVVEEN